MSNYSKLFSCPRKKILIKARPIQNAISLNLFNRFNSSAKFKTHYETLHLSKNCTSKEIREAFISLSKKWHPDKNKNNANAEAQFVKVNEAYTVLSKPESRREYDLTLLHYNNRSRTYNSPHREEFYTVHRYNAHYRNPWNDPSFARNRKFSEKDTDDYYGIKGLKKVSNDQVLLCIMIFFFAGIFFEMLTLKSIQTNRTDSLKRSSEENVQYLEFVRQRAEMYGSRERQIEEFKRSLNINSEN